MLFTEKIKELRIQNHMPQRQIAAALDIDTATYCKIEKGERRAKKEQVAILSEIDIDEIDNCLTLSDK
ncbi:MAG: helix-turn-helix transcriptional regulator [Bacteroidales bacterium]|nr:helix-turn-helix transcriptional regulator [Bacteroidales bacterium]